MFEIILSTMFIAGKVEVAPNIFEYDIITYDNAYHKFVADENQKIIEYIQ